MAAMEWCVQSGRQNARRNAERALERLERRRLGMATAAKTALDRPV
jgi:hypothetical protein